MLVCLVFASCYFLEYCESKIMRASGWLLGQLFCRVCMQKLIHFDCSSKINLNEPIESTAENKLKTRTLEMNQSFHTKPVEQLQDILYSIYRTNYL